MNSSIDVLTGDVLTGQVVYHSNKSNSYFLALSTLLFLFFTTNPVLAEESNVGLSEGEWYTRLTVESEPQVGVTGLKDSANVFGQLKSSVSDHDQHDLKELDPFSSPYLSVVFSHPDWGDRAADYSSDYHGVMDESTGDSWDFEVRSDDPHRQVTLSWRVTDTDIMARSTLLDNMTGHRIKVMRTPKGGNEPIVQTRYGFNMAGETTRSFRWIVVADNLKDRPLPIIPVTPTPRSSENLVVLDEPARDTHEGAENAEVLLQVMRTDYQLGTPPGAN